MSKYSRQFFFCFAFHFMQKNSCLLVGTVDVKHVKRGFVAKLGASRYISTFWYKTTDI